MRINTTSIALLALPALTLAGPNDPVALFDFKPRVENVSGDCNKVYEQKVPGCFGKDFGQQGCSVECVKGLESMTQLVKDSCSNDGLQDSNKDLNILAYFLGGDGPQSVCTNAAKVLQSLSSSAAESTTSQHSSTPSSTQQTTASIASSTMTASSTDVPTSIVMDTSALSESTSSASSTRTGKQSDTASSTTSQIFQAPSMPSTWSMATASSTPSPSSGGHSGGGSPFDAEGNEFSAATSITSSAVTLALAVMFAGLAAQW